MSVRQREALGRGIQPHDEASLRIVEFECNNPWDTVKGDSQPLYLENSMGLQRTDQPNLAEGSRDHKSSVEKPVSSVQFSHVASPDSGKGSGMERPNTDRMLSIMIGLSAMVALPVFVFLWRGIQKDKGGRGNRHARQWTSKRPIICPFRQQSLRTDPQSIYRCFA
jgi:hypothetical protein